MGEPPFPPRLLLNTTFPSHPLDINVCFPSSPWEGGSWSAPACSQYPLREPTLRDGINKARPSPALAPGPTLLTPDCIAYKWREMGGAGGNRLGGPPQPRREEGSWDPARQALSWRGPPKSSSPLAGLQGRELVLAAAGQ